MSETVHDPLVGYYRDEAGRWVIADAGDHFPALVDDRTATLLDALAIARQQLADVAYLEKWLSGAWARGVSRDDDGLYVYDGTETEGPYLNVGPCATFSALGALLRQREGGR